MLSIPQKYRLHIFIVLIVTFAQLKVYALSKIEGDLPRRADLGFRFSSDGHIVVSRLTKGSPAAAADLRENDIITSINQHPIKDILEASGKLRRVLGGETLALKIKRGDKTLKLSFTPEAKSLEQIPGIDSYYGVVDISKSTRLRSIVSAPSGNDKPLPAIFFVQWVSCGSLEFNPRSNHGRVMSDIIKQTKRTFIRVDRTTSGDSQGPLCHQLDYNTEIEHYYKAFLKLKNHPLVDPNKIVIYGSSLGSTVAPLLAERLLKNGHKVAGIAVQGGGAVSYFERMLNFERNYLERKLNSENLFVSAADIQDEFIQRSLFYTEYLIHGRHPDKIAKDSKIMAKVRGNILGLNKYEHYGRPFSWHQQAAQHNFLLAWKNSPVPVLVIFNEFDQYEQRHGHRIIVDMVNRWRPGSGSFIEQKGIGHSNYQYASTEDAYNYKGGKAVPEKLAQHIISWLGNL
ncbi:PDZ domain-containing protein [Agarilytica rhodophyticola]|uniref:PDZ domain-containing protein n=1 Tax=Agarilytica rhodophyticola TaxID=1737490 RepID=UPI001319D056|nr:PDZ domain-containing protein [Agarilytica rhodophyticola]